MAVNAAIVKQAAAARLAMASQALRECREQNNPFLPGNSLFGPTRTQMWGPDPCQTQEKDLAEAAQAAAQISAAPTLQNQEVNPAPELSITSTDHEGSQIPEFQTLDPTVQNMWSPDSVLEVMDQIVAELDGISPESSSPSESIQQELAEVQQDMELVTMFLCWGKPPAKRRRYQFLPKSAKWLGRFLPNDPGK